MRSGLGARGPPERAPRPCAGTPSGENVEVMPGFSGQFGMAGNKEAAMTAQTPHRERAPMYRPRG